MPRCLLALLFLTLSAFTAGAKENLYSVKIRRPGVDLWVQELIRNRTTSTVQSLQRIPHSKPGHDAFVQAMRELARERGANYFRMEKPYGETMSGEFQIVHFYQLPVALTLRRLYSAKGPENW
jgi:hypothetical protein